MKGKSILLFSLLLSPVLLPAQSGSLERARQLHNEYKFDQAVAICEKLMDTATDKEERDRIFEQMVLSENGRSMLLYGSEPAVVAEMKVPRKDFFLWYSHLRDKSWTPEGNYFPEGEDRYFYSEGGDIVYTFQKDSVMWSAPEVPSPEMKSAGHEIFPMLSPDGKELFFSSDGLFGMGGYDLFVCRWDEDEKKWGPVQNVGFPFSSTADDLLYTYTPDNSYIVFASNRACDADNVVIYVARYENYLHKMFSQSEAAAAARLSAANGGKEEYVFRKMNPGTRPDIRQEEAVPDVDYTFRVESKSEVVQGNPLPKGIAYQIRILLSNAKVKNQQLKGFCPVFEERQSSGKYIYYVGIFRKYKDVTAALKKVKAKFPSAYVVAYENGKPLQVAKARDKESKVTVVSEEVRIVTGD